MRIKRRITTNLTKVMRDAEPEIPYIVSLRYDYTCIECGYTETDCGGNVPLYGCHMCETGTEFRLETIENGVHTKSEIIDRSRTANVGITQVHDSIAIDVAALAQNRDLAGLASAVVDRIAQSALFPTVTFSRESIGRASGSLLSAPPLRNREAVIPNTVTRRYSAPARPGISQSLPRYERVTLSALRDALTTELRDSVSPGIVIGLGTTGRSITIIDDTEDVDPQTIVTGQQFREYQASLGDERAADLLGQRPVPDLPNRLTAREMANDLLTLGVLNRNVAITDTSFNQTTQVLRITTVLNGEEREHRYSAEFLRRYFGQALDTYAVSRQEQEMRRTVAQTAAAFGVEPEGVQRMVDQMFASAVSDEEMQSIVNVRETTPTYVGVDMGASPDMVSVAWTDPDTGEIVNTTVYYPQTE